MNRYNLVTHGDVCEFANEMDYKNHNDLYWLAGYYLDCMDGARKRLLSAIPRADLPTFVNAVKELNHTFPGGN